MEDLIRFILARPPQAVKLDKTTVPTRPSKDLDKALKDAKASSDPRAAAKRAAIAHSSSPDAPDSPSELKYGVALRGLVEAISDGADKSLGDLATTVKNLFAAEADDVVASAEFPRTRERLSDALIANAILGRDGSVSSDDAAKLLRATVIVERVAAKDLELAAKGGVARAIESTIMLPGDLFPLVRPTESAQRPPAGHPEIDTERRCTALRSQRDRLLSTYTMLTRITPDHIAVAETAEPTGGECHVKHEARASLPPMVRAEAAETVAEELRGQRTRQVQASRFT